VIVRSGGSPKHSIGLAALWESANSRFRHRCMPVASVTATATAVSDQEIGAAIDPRRW
jgi:hypothetical protein